MPQPVPESIDAAREEQQRLAGFIENLEAMKQQENVVRIRAGYLEGWLEAQPNVVAVADPAANGTGDATDTMVVAEA